MSTPNTPPRFADKIDKCSGYVRGAFDEMPERYMAVGFVLLLLLAFLVLPLLVVGLTGEIVAPSAPAAPVVLVHIGAAPLSVWLALTVGVCL